MLFISASHCQRQNSTEIDYTRTRRWSDGTVAVQRSRSQHCHSRSMSVLFSDRAVHRWMAVFRSVAELAKLNVNDRHFRQSWITLALGHLAIRF